MRNFSVITYILPLLAAAMLGAVCGCSSKADSAEIDESLALAYSLIDRGDYARAVDICDDMTAGIDSAAMTWYDYCRAATVYAAAYDHDYDTEASMAAATKCLSRARTLQPDSVQNFLNTLSHELSGPLNTVAHTLDGLNTDRSTFGDHEQDEDYRDISDNDEEHQHEHSHGDMTAGFIFATVHSVF